jgi:hypothetical protein
MKEILFVLIIYGTGPNQAHTVVGQYSELVCYGMRNYINRTIRAAGKVQGWADCVPVKPMTGSDG